MNFFHHKDLGNHLLQLCPKVIKHPVYINIYIKAGVTASEFSNFVARLDTHDMKVYVGKDRQHTAQHVTANCVIVTELTRKIEAHGQLHLIP